MSSEKRMVLFVIVAVLSIVVFQQAAELLGFNPPPAAPGDPAVAEGEAEPGAEVKNAEADKPKVEGIAEKTAKKDEPGKPPEVAKVKLDEVPHFKDEELVLGSSRRDQGSSGYLLELHLAQGGAGVAYLESAKYDAEYVEGKPKNRPFRILQEDLLAPNSLALTLRDPKQAADLEADPDAASAAAKLVAAGAEIPLDAVSWEVIKDDEGHVVRPLRKTLASNVESEGQELVFRAKVNAWDLVITKTYRLWKGEEGFEVDLNFASPKSERTFAYKLLGPHGVPIEGEWYTSTFRDAIVGLPNGSGTKVVTLSAYDIVKNKEKPERFQTEPIRFAGIENQYFVSFLQPDPYPATTSDRWDSETLPVPLHVNEENKSKSDIGVEIVSKPLTVGPNVSVSHHYRVFAGAKTVESLKPYHAEDIANYRKSNWIPFAPDIARMLISPLLGMTYKFTEQTAKIFGGKRGNYGVAIILLTMLVRMAMFPLGRKQAMSAKKMQDLQPQMKAMQEKYKDDKEAITRETWALYKRNGVNPVSGCVPALIQMPIFVGLWQALNNSVFLRHAHFLYIDNLAAPDMLFKFPFEMPSFIQYYIGNYFNLLPFLVVSLMLVQTKLFSPPPTTPEAEQQQKMMKFMMIFMAFMFYKVPSGLGIYFITSSTWQISERLLLPKPKTKIVDPSDLEVDDDLSSGGGGGGKNGDGGRGPGNAPQKPQGKFGQFWEKVLHEAAKNPTYRNLTDDKERQAGTGNGNGADRDRGRERDPRKPRPKPGRRR